MQVNILPSYIIDLFAGRQKWDIIEFLHIRSYEHGNGIAFFIIDFLHVLNIYYIILYLYFKFHIYLLVQKIQISHNNQKLYFSGMLIDLFHNKA